MQDSGAPQLLCASSHALGSSPSPAQGSFCSPGSGRDAPLLSPVAPEDPTVESALDVVVDAATVESVGPSPSSAHAGDTARDTSKQIEAMRMLEA